MKSTRPFLGMILFLLAHASISSPQTEKTANRASAPPKLLLLVHQQFKFGSEGTRQKLEAAMVRACERLDVPNSWIDLQSITGPSEALSFDPFDSFGHIGTAYAGWGQIYASHPKLAELQDQIRVLETRERSVIAARRDDLGYRVSQIDLSKARFMRVLEVRVRPGHESDFVESFKLLGAAYEKMSADMPWVVYQVNTGMPSPTFLVFVPMRALNENDSYLARAPKLREAEGDVNADRLHQIARDAYESSESNLYAISPATSHVSREFADGDPDFWLLKQSSAVKPPASSATADNSPRKRRQAQPRQ
jgi:hypothetical protein